MKLLIAIPTTDYIHAEFMKSLLALTRKLTDDGVDYEVVIENGTLVYMARERLANKAIRHGFTHILWLDSDMVFTPEIVEDLQFSGKSFVSGIAVSRRKPFSSCLFKNLDLAHLERWGDKLPNDTFEVAGCGFACVLMETQICVQLKGSFGTCFTPLENYGEDTSFCRRCNINGIRLYAEPSVKVGHIGHITIYPDDAPRYRDEIH